MDVGQTIVICSVRKARFLHLSNPQKSPENFCHRIQRRWQQSMGKNFCGYIETGTPIIWPFPPSSFVFVRSNQTHVQLKFIGLHIHTIVRFHARTFLCHRIQLHAVEECGPFVRLPNLNSNPSQPDARGESKSQTLRLTDCLGQY